MKTRHGWLTALVAFLLLTAPAAAAPAEDLGPGLVHGRQALTNDGRYVIFESDASDLVPDDTNGARDIFVRDRVTGTVERVSVSSAGVQGDRGSRDGAISADGRYVTFVSEATSLVPGDTNANSLGGCCWGDVFIRDRQTGLTERVSVTSDEAEGPGFTPAAPTVSADGRFVAFRTGDKLADGDNNNTYDAYLRDRVAGTTTWVSRPASGFGEGALEPMVSADGSKVAFYAIAPLVAADTNGRPDIYVRATAGGVLALASVATGTDGSQGGGAAYLSSISADGRHVAFTSYVPELVPGDTNGVNDVYVRDTVANTTERVSVGGAGRQANGPSDSPMISADGRFVGFRSSATNVIPGHGQGGLGGGFVRDRQLLRTRAPRNASRFWAMVMGADGRTLAFYDGERSHATTLAPNPDATPPSLALPDELELEAHSAGGATVSINAEVSDNTDAEPTYGCFPGHTDPLPLGTTTVRCIAADEAGNEREDTVEVTIRDSRPPRVRAPKRIAVDAVGPNGAPVTVLAEAHDAVDGHLEPVCAPGGTFPIGTTTVRCTATDQAGNSAHADVDVVVTERAPVPSVSVASVRVSEGYARAFVQITLSEPATEAIEVRWSLADGTATAPSDFEPQEGGAFFQPGQRSEVVLVELKNDRMIEPDETLTIHLTGGPAGPRRDTGTITIAEDDREIVNRRGTSNGPLVFAGADEDGRRGRLFEAAPGGPEEQLLREPSGAVLKPAVSPDGRRVLYLAPRSGLNVGLADMIKEYDRVTGRTRVVTGMSGIGRTPTGPAWRPDGEAFAWTTDYEECYRCRSELHVSTEDGLEYSIELLGMAHHMAWSPDGRRIAYDHDIPTSEDTLDVAILDLATGVSTPVQGASSAATHEAWPTWSPDGSKLAIELGDGDDTDIAVIPAAGGQVVRMPEGGDDREPAWSPNGQRIAFVRDGTVVTTTPGGFSPATVGEGVAPDWVPLTDAIKPTIDLRRPVDGAEFEVGDAATPDFDCADEGGSGVVSCAGGQIDTAAPGVKPFTVTAIDGAGNTTTVTVHYRVRRVPGRIAFERGGDVRLVDGDGANERRVTQGSDPSLSADGDRLAFVRGGSIVLAALDGTGEQVLTPPVAARRPRLSPDGERVVFTAGDDVWVMNADGTGAHLVTAGTDPVWHPDGDRILLASGGEIVRMNADGGGRVTLATGPAETRDPAISRDGSTLAFRGRAGGGAWALYAMAADGTQERVVRPAIGDAGRIAIAPDGRRVAFTTSGTQVISARLDGEPREKVAAAGVLGDWAPIPPEPRATHRLAGSLQIAFDAGASTDADGAIAEYRWRFGDGQTATGAQVTHSYPEEVTYTVTLTVRDDTGARATTELAVDPIKGILTIGEPAPAASFVGVDKRLRCGALGPDGRPLFDGGGTACGTFVALGGTLYGPPGAIAGDYEAFTPVTQASRTGAGTESDPYVLQTTVALGSTGVRLVQSDSYVKGRPWWRSDAELVNTAGTPVTARLYRAGDCSLGGADAGGSLADPATATAGCRATTAASALMPLSAGARHQAGAAEDVFAPLLAGAEPAGTCACTGSSDHAAAIGWTVPLAAGEHATRSALTAYPADGRLPALLTLAADQDPVEPLGDNAFTVTLRNPNAGAIELEGLSATVDDATYLAGSTTGMTTADPVQSSGDILTWTGLGSIAGHGGGTLRFGVRHGPEDGAADARAAVDVDWPVVGRTATSIRPVATARVTVQRTGGTPPNTAITKAPPALGNDAAPTITFVANEPGATFQCRVAPAAFAPCASPHGLPALADGPHAFEVRAVGAAGVDPSPATASFRIDTTAPQTALVAAPPALTRLMAPTFKLSASEEARLECRLRRHDQTPAFAECPWTFVGSVPADGKYVFEGRAVDAAGNADPTPARHEFVVDTTPPETVIDAVDGRVLGDVDGGAGGRPAGGASGAVQSRIALTGDGTAPLRLACPASAKEPCRGTVGLATDLAMLAQAEFEIPPGGTADLALALPAAVRNRIERSGRLPVVVTIGDDSGRAVRGDELVLEPDPRTPRVRDAGLEVPTGDDADLRLTCPRGKTGGCLGSVELLRAPAGYARSANRGAAAIAAGRSLARAAKGSRLARARFRVRRGATARARVVLPRAARRLVRRSGRVRVLVRVTTRQRRGRPIRKTVDLTLTTKEGRR